MVESKVQYSVLCVLFWLTCLGAYESRYDSIGPEALIRNKRLYQKYFDCIVRDAKCTPDAKFIKDLVADALPTLCKKCNDKQRHFADTVVSYMIANRPEDFAELEKKYDPKGVFRKDLEKRKPV